MVGTSKCRIYEELPLDRGMGFGLYVQNRVYINFKQVFPNESPGEGGGESVFFLAFTMRVTCVGSHIIRARKEDKEKTKTKR